MARYRKRQRAIGAKPCNVMAPERWHGLFTALAEALRRQPNLQATEFLVYWRDPQGRLHPLKELVPS
jgi:hypothetical protein